MKNPYLDHTCGMNFKVAGNKIRSSLSNIRTIAFGITRVRVSRTLTFTSDLYL